MNTILHGRLAALAGFIALAALLAACSASDGAGGTSCAVTSGDSTPTTLAGTWCGTWTQGTPNFTTARPLAHTTIGSLTLVFVDTGSDTFTGTIGVNADICWTALDHTTGQQAQVDLPLTITADVTGSRVDFDYDSPIDSGSNLVRLAGPYPPTTSWSGSYDGALCSTSEDASTWIGNFTVTKQ